MSASIAILLSWAGPNLEMIGEAANRVTVPGRARYQNIASKNIINTRNRIVHGYDTVNYDTVWKIIKDELPVLIAALESALPGHSATSHRHP